MKTILSSALLAGASLQALATTAVAEDGPGFVWEGEIEIGNDQVVSSNTPGNEIRDTYASFYLSGAYTFGSGIRIFGALTAESLTGATMDRTFDDMGVYVEELNISFPVGSAVTITAGKLHPVFGRAWDEAAGFYGSAFSEDYELIEQIGIIADFDGGDAGVFSFALFYADDTVLSNSWGFRRGRNTTAAGGAGNTGQLDNVALAWTKEFGDTSVQLAARRLSAGTGDVSDETGVVASIGHTFASGLYLFGEAAAFDGFGGTADNARYVTLNAAYGVGEHWTFSGGVGSADIDSAGKTDMVTLAAEYTLNDSLTFGAGVARVKGGGVRDTLVGINLIWTFGG